MFRFLRGKKQENSTPPEQKIRESGVSSDSHHAPHDTQSINLTDTHTSTTLYLPQTDEIMNTQPNSHNNHDIQSALQNNTSPQQKYQWEQESDSWSEILMSDSEKNRRMGSQTKPKDTNMVVLVRRLEAFPKSSVIASTRSLFTDELERLLKVKDVIDTESNQLADQNPILHQALLEVESELAKIKIEQEAFEKKLQSEVEIIDGLVQSIIAHENKKPQLISALLKHYDFDLDAKNVVIHMSNEEKLPSQDKKTTSQSQQKQNTSSQAHAFTTLKPAEALTKGQ